jgi:hypothetical protein
LGSFAVKAASTGPAGSDMADGKSRLANWQNELAKLARVARIGGAPLMLLERLMERRWLPARLGGEAASG